MDYVAEVERLKKLLLEAFDKQSALESRIEELTVDHEQFNCLNDENDVLGIENEKLKRHIAELEARLTKGAPLGSGYASAEDYNWAIREADEFREQVHLLNQKIVTLEQITKKRDLVISGSVVLQEMQQRIAELEAQVATFTAAGQIIENHIDSLRETHEPVTATSTDTHGGISFDGTGRLTKEFPHL